MIRERIPVFAPHIGADTLQHVQSAFDAGWLGMGALTKQFEERISEFLGLRNRFVVATNTGTSALHAALAACGIGEGDEVITPSFNYVADHQAILAAGAEVAMCDVRDEDLNIDCASAESLVSERTKAIMPLHFAGLACDRAGIYGLAKARGLRVIEDCTHAFGSVAGGATLGSEGDIAVFSFDPVKTVTAVDGGAVVVSTAAEQERLRRFRFLGIDKETAERYKNKRAWDYDVVSAGYRYHLNNIMASVGLSQIKRAREFIASRQTVCRAYSDAFRDLPGLRVPPTDFEGVSPFIYSLRVIGGRRDAFIAALDAAGVDAGIHFVPVHRHSYFAACRRSAMNVTEAAANQVVTLPLHSNMKAEFVERVIGAVSAFARG